MPKIPVVEANLTAEARKTLECEHYAAEVVRALRAHDDEGAARAFAGAVERLGNEFLEHCQKLPVKVRKMLGDMKFGVRGEKPRS
jgi:hypothetical protein